MSDFNNPKRFRAVFNTRGTPQAIPPPLPTWQEVARSPRDLFRSFQFQYPLETYEAVHGVFSRQLSNRIADSFYDQAGVRAGDFIYWKAVLKIDNAALRRSADSSQERQFAAPPREVRGRNTVYSVLNEVLEMVENYYSSDNIISMELRASVIRRPLGYRGSGLPTPAEITAFNTSFTVGTFSDSLYRKDRTKWDILSMKRAYVPITEMDNLCFIRAFMYTMVFHYRKAKSGSKSTPHNTLPGYLCTLFKDKVDGLLKQEGALDKHVTTYLKSKLKINDGFMNRLCRAVGQSIGVGVAGVGQTECEKLASEFNVKIRMLNGLGDLSLRYETLNQPVVPQGENVHYIPILMDGAHHCHAVTSVPAAAGKKKYCGTCHKVYDNELSHRTCPRKCCICHTIGCQGSRYYNVDFHGVDDPAKMKLCEDCNYYFTTIECYENHRKKGTGFRGNQTGSRCDEHKRCGKEGCKGFRPFLYNPAGEWEGEHVCGDFFCKNCKKMVRKDHQCFVQKKAPKDFLKIEKMIIMDFECEQTQRKHNVTHAVAQYADFEEGEEGSEEKRFCFMPKDAENGDYMKVIDLFCTWLFCKEHEGFTVIAHNGGGYDYQFILDWALNNGKEPKKMVQTGSKIKMCEIEGLRFIDSLCFLPFALEKLPAMFGIKGMKKGFFPHLFNRPENHGTKIEGLPPLSLYLPEQKKSSAYEEIKNWHFVEDKRRRETGELYDFDKEIMDYCKDDVTILQKVVLQFRNSFTESGVDPFAYTTIASACSALYRSRFMPENSIASLTNKVKKYVYGAFFGGRTDVKRPYYKMKEGEEGRYDDVKSLYPSVNMFCEYPIGHGVFEEYECFEDEARSASIIRSTFGVLEVSVIAPKDLYHPLLPERRDGKLLFPLDFEEGKGYRWTSVELQKALHLGYRFPRVFSRYHYPQKSTQLFRPYVQHFLKAKEEASGWGDKYWKGEKIIPEKKDSQGKKVKDVEVIEGLLNDEERHIVNERKHLWLKDYEESMGIKLDPERIKYNASLRQVAKLCLNSLWGKFAQRDVQTTYKYFPVDEEERVYFMLKKNHRKAVSIEEIGGYIVLGYNDKSKTIKDEDVANFNTNMAVALFTTAHARLKLYSALEKLGTRVLYYDTDSVIYVKGRDGVALEIGDKLGEWTDELEGDPIVEFIAPAPKCYAYLKKSGGVGLTSKGQRLCILSERQGINLENYRNAVLSMHDESREDGVAQPPDKRKFQHCISEPGRIAREHYMLHTLPEYTKTFQPVLNKGNLDTRSWFYYPLGYKGPLYGIES